MLYLTINYILNTIFKYCITDYNLACIDMYCSRLQERSYAKELVHDYQLMDRHFFFREKPKHRLTLEEKYVDYVINYLL